MMRDWSLTSGFSVIEVVLGAALLSIIVAAFTGSIITGQESARVAGEYSRANWLVSEGLEAARNIRDGGFSDLSSGTHGLAVSGGQWELQGVSDTIDVFTRTLEVVDVDSDRKQVTATVTWQATLQRATDVSAVTYLTNWQDISGGGGGLTCDSFCSDLSYSGGTCRQNAQRCGNNSETHESGGDQYCTGGANADTCCCAP